MGDGLLPLQRYQSPLPILDPGICRGKPFHGGGRGSRSPPRLQNLQVTRTVELTEDLIGRRKDRLEQNLFMFDRASSIVPILGNYDLPKTLQAR